MTLNIQPAVQEHPQPALDLTQLNVTELEDAMTSPNIKGEYISENYAPGWEAAVKEDVVAQAERAGMSDRKLQLHAGVLVSLSSNNPSKQHFKK